MAVGLVGSATTEDTLAQSTADGLHRQLAKWIARRTAASLDRVRPYALLVSPLLLVAVAACSLVFPSEGYAGSGSKCAGATFCDDFERTDVVGHWTGAKTASGGQLDLFTADGGTSLRFAYANADAAGTDSPKGYLFKEGFAGKAFAIDFDAYGDVAAGFFDVIAIEWKYGSGLSLRTVFQISSTGGSTAIQVVDTSAGDSEVAYATTPFSSAPGTRRWFHGQLGVTLLGTTFTSKAFVDGTLVATASIPNVQAGPVTLSAGGASFAAKGSGFILVDDVRVVATP